MGFTLKELTKEVDSVDITDILSCWQWLLGDMKTVHIISCLGDLFLIGKDNGIYWLQIDCGELLKVAEDSKQFQEFLADAEKFDEWFLPQLVEELINAGKTLKSDEVYSYKILPIMGGEYSVENIEPTDMSVHFAFIGQICEQIKNLPDGTPVKIVIKK